MREPSSSPAGAHDAPGKLHGLAQALLKYVRARVDLLQHELGEEQSRLLGKLARAGIFALGALITLQLIAAFVLIAFWDTPWRLHAAGALVLLFGGVTWFAWRGMKGSGTSEPAFASSIAELDKDREILDRLHELRAEVPKRDEPKPASSAPRAPLPVPPPRAHADAGVRPLPAATMPQSRRIP